MHSVLLGAAACGTFWIWVEIYFAVIRDVPPPTYLRYGVYAALVTGAFAVDYVISKLSRTDLLRMDFLASIRLSSRQLVTVVICMLLFLAGSRDTVISRLFVLSFIPVLYGVLLALNRGLPRLLTSALFHSKRRQRTLLIGSGHQALRMGGWLESQTSYGLDVVGLITEPGEASDSLPWPILGGNNDLEQLVRSTGATQVIALNVPNSMSRAARTASLCESLGVRLLIVNDLEEKI